MSKQPTQKRLAQKPYDPYEFILSPDPPPKAGAFSGGKAQKQRLLVFAAGGGALLVFFIILFAIIFSGGDAATERLVSIAKQQTEIIRVADIGIEKAKTTTTRNLGTTTKLTLDSSQRLLLEILKRRGQELKSKDLAADKNLQTDAALTAAEQSNRFDEVFTTTMQTSLRNLLSDIRQATSLVSSKKDRDFLQATAQQIDAILDQLPAPNSGA